MSEIRTLKDGETQIAPRTVAKAVSTAAGKTVEAALGEAATQIASMQKLKRNNIMGAYPVKTGQTIHAGDVVDVVGGEVTGKRMPLSMAPVGATFEIYENGLPAEFIVLQKDYESALNGAGKVLVVRKNVYANTVFNANASNAYIGGTLDTMLNGAYKGLLPQDVQQSIGTTLIKYKPGNGNYGVSNIARSIFELSLSEYGGADGNADGVAISYFSTKERRMVEKPQAGACYQWTRSPSTTNTGYANTIGNDGEFRSDPTNDSARSYMYARPAFTLPASYQIELTNATASQAIALQAATSGQQCEVIFDGVAELPGFTAGTEISSPGVYGYCPEDGTVWVRPEWDGGVVTGSYIGNGTTQSINLSFRPKLVVINCFNVGGGIAIDDGSASLIMRGASQTVIGGYLQIKITQTGFDVTQASPASEGPVNTNGSTFNFVALK